MSLITVIPSVLAVNPRVVSGVLNVEVFDHLSVKNRQRVCCVTLNGLKHNMRPHWSEIKPNSGKTVSVMFSCTRDVYGEVLSAAGSNLS